MSQIIDLTGKRFGKWTVSSFDSIGTDGAKWNCVCDCGAKRAVSAHSLRRGRSVSCGCGRPAALAAKAKTQEERFWSKVKIGPSEKCWPWLAARYRNGYGAFTRHRSAGEWGNVLAHRVSFELTHGPVPEGLFVMHLCSNRICVNPSHLQAGTPVQNMRQASAEGSCSRARQRVLKTKPESVPRGAKHWAWRHPAMPNRGENNGQAKLTELQVTEIKRLVREGHTHGAVASRFGVGRPYVTHIMNGKKWRHVP